MNPEVAHLLELQEIDRELLELRTQLSLLPGIWEKTKSRHTGAKTRFETAEREQKGHTDSRQRIEKQLREATDLMRRSQLQQTLVKTQKEYTAITTQIEGIRARVSTLEREGLAELERETALAAELVAAKAELEEAERFAKTEHKRMRVQVDEKKAAIGELDKARDAALERVSPDMRQLYVRLSRRWPASAVVPVRGGSCSGCNFRLLSHSLVAVHRGETLQTCDHCGRILSHDEDQKKSAPAEE